MDIILILWFVSGLVKGSYEFVHLISLNVAEGRLVR